MYGNSFVEMEKTHVEKTMNNLIMKNGKLYDIRDLIKYVLRVKEYFHKLDYDLNLFAYPMNKRYIRLKSGVTSPIKRSPKSPSKSPSPSKKRIRLVGGSKTKKNKSQKYRHRRKQNKRTKKNVRMK
jgi:hypothetical protein